MIVTLKNIQLSTKSIVLSIGLILTLFLILSTKNAFAGFGPSTRPTYDWNKYNASVSCTDPSNAYGRCGSMNGPVFDSFINTPSYGDEENFTQIAPVQANQSPINASYSNTAQANPGQEYWVRMLVHNDGNQNLNCLPQYDSATLNDCTQVNLGSPSIATNTTVQVAIANGVANGVDIMGYISASNATPSSIWDSATLVNPNQAFSVSYVNGSASIYNSAFPNGLSLPDSIASSTGTLIGYNQMNGIFPGCFNYSAYVYVKVLVSSPALKIQKFVRNSSTSNWSSAITANAGSIVQWKITYQDTGTVNDNNVTLSDSIPQGLTIVPGSIKWYDANNNGTVQADTSLSSGGIDLGNYAPSPNDINGEIVYDTVVNNNPSTCTINNIAYGKADNVSTVSSSAEVNINNCSITPPTTSTITPPTTLVNTGPGNVIGVFVGFVIVGIVGFKFYTKKKLVN